MNIFRAILDLTRKPAKSPKDTRLPATCERDEINVRALIDALDSDIRIAVLEHLKELRDWYSAEHHGGKPRPESIANHATQFALSLSFLNVPMHQIDSLIRSRLPSAFWNEFNAARMQTQMDHAMRGAFACPPVSMPDEIDLATRPAD